MNEVMGLPFDGGLQPVTEADVRACCADYALPETEDEEVVVAAEHAQYPAFAGLDWAMTTDESTPSYTKFAVFALVNGRLKLIKAHQFTGLGSDDPDHVLGRIGRWMECFNVQLLGCDYGVGYKENQRLMAAYLFATYPIARVEASTDITNMPEQRALEKAGFTREGVLRKAQWRAGAWHDLVVYSKLRGE